MGRYAYLPMEYKEYCNKFVNTLKTGELLVDLDDFDIYVTEEGVNIPIPVLSPLRQEIIDYLDNDLEGIKLKMKITPEKIDGLFKQKSEIDELQQNIYSRIETLYARRRDVRNRLSYINVINGYNINQLGDLSFNLGDLNDDVNIYIEEMKNLIALFNYYNTDCRSIYSNNYKNRNTELIRIWKEIEKLFRIVNTKLVKMGKANGFIELKKIAVENGTIYDVDWDRSLYNLESFYGRKEEATGENSYLNLVYAAMHGTSESITLNDINRNITLCFSKFMLGTRFNKKSQSLIEYNLGVGSNLLYPGFALKINSESEEGSQNASPCPHFTCAELPPLDGFSYSGTWMDNNRLPKPRIEYVQSIISRIIPFYLKSEENTFFANSEGYQDLIDKVRNKSGIDYSVSCKPSYNPNKDIAYNSNVNISIPNNNFSNEYKFVSRDNDDFFVSSSGKKDMNDNAYMTGQILPKYALGLDTSGNILYKDKKGNDFIEAIKNGINNNTYSGSIYSKILPSVAVVTKNIKFQAVSGSLNTDGFIFRLGLKKQFNETKLSDSIQLNYDNKNGWVKQE